MAARLALVTGATGFIGSRLVPALVAAGWSVRACGRRSRPASLPDEVDYRGVDLAAGELDDLCRGVTHVFHLAGASSSLSSPDDMHRSNVVATERLLDAAAGGGRSPQRFLYMSSTSVYGEETPLPSPVREDVEPHPSRGYGKAKWRTEQAVWAAADAGLDAVVVRPVSVYGPGNIKLLASAALDVAIERFADRVPVLVPSPPVEQRLVHIDDVVRACLHLAVHDGAAGHAYNVVFPSYPSSHTVAGILAGELGVATEPNDDPDCGPTYEEREAVRAEMLAAGMRPDILLTEERFRFLRKANPNNRLSIDALLGTGFRFTDESLEVGIRRTVAWYLDHQWIL
jgi:nucleoside-diphosphate-sugar epimerase